MVLFSLLGYCGKLPSLGGTFFVSAERNHFQKKKNRFGSASTSSWSSDTSKEKKYRPPPKTFERNPNDPCVVTSPSGNDITHRIYDPSVKLLNCNGWRVCQGIVTNYCSNIFCKGEEACRGARFRNIITPTNNVINTTLTSYDDDDDDRDGDFDGYFLRHRSLGNRGNNHVKQFDPNNPKSVETMNQHLHKNVPNEKKQGQQQKQQQQQQQQQKQQQQQQQQQQNTTIHDQNPDPKSNPNPNNNNNKDHVQGNKDDENNNNKDHVQGSNKDENDEDHVQEANKDDENNGNKEGKQHKVNNNNKKQQGKHHKNNNVQGKHHNSNKGSGEDDIVAKSNHDDDGGGKESKDEDVVTMNHDQFEDDEDEDNEIIEDGPGDENEFEDDDDEEDDDEDEDIIEDDTHYESDNIFWNHTIGRGTGQIRCYENACRNAIFSVATEVYTNKMLQDHVDVECIDREACHSATFTNVHNVRCTGNLACHATKILSHGDIQCDFADGKGLRKRACTRGAVMIQTGGCLMCGWKYGCTNFDLTECKYGFLDPNAHLEKFNWADTASLGIRYMKCPENSINKIVDNAICPQAWPNELMTEQVEQKLTNSTGQGDGEKDDV